MFEIPLKQHCNHEQILCSAFEPYKSYLLLHVWKVVITWQNTLSSYKSYTVHSSQSLTLMPSCCALCTPKSIIKFLLPKGCFDCLRFHFLWSAQKRCCLIFYEVLHKLELTSIESPQHSFSLFLHTLLVHVRATLPQSKVLFMILTCVSHLFMSVFSRVPSQCSLIICIHFPWTSHH